MVFRFVVQQRSLRAIAGRAEISKENRQSMPHKAFPGVAA
jgi:hypothetical protein